MLSNITLGQYIPKNSLVHHLDSRTKIILTLIYIVSIFFISHPVFYFVPLLFLLIAVHYAQLPLRIILSSLKPVKIILLLTFFMNLFLYAEGQILFKFYFIKITSQGLLFAVHFSLRLILMVLGASILTLTTSTINIANGIESLLKPLEKIHFPAHELAMMMTIALRFIPTLIDETDKIMKAQISRGADFETGNILQRAKAMLPLLVPLFVSAFRRANDLAMAMEARCYHGGEGRTKYVILHYSKLDVYATLTFALYALIILVLYYCL